MLAYILGITNRDSLRDFKIGAKRLQIGTGISSRGKDISNWGRQ